MALALTVKEGAEAPMTIITETGKLIEIRFSKSKSYNSAVLYIEAPKEIRILSSSATEKEGINYITKRKS
jgi:hypothetical protein